MRTKERVREYADKHPTATVREIQTALGLSSPSVVQFHLKVDSKDTIIEAKDKRIAELEAENTRLRANIERLTANPADYRYWEGRYRDAADELDQLKAQLG